MHVVTGLLLSTVQRIPGGGDSALLFRVRQRSSSQHHSPVRGPEPAVWLCSYYSPRDGVSLSPDTKLQMTRQPRRDVWRFNCPVPPLAGLGAPISRSSGSGSGQPTPAPSRASEPANLSPNAKATSTARSGEMPQHTYALTPEASQSLSPGQQGHATAQPQQPMQQQQQQQKPGHDSRRPQSLRTTTNLLHCGHTDDASCMMCSKEVELPSIGSHLPGPDIGALRKARA
ncbi:unnamed protein product [Protopolystoma xenopodis]|uniref:Uncharacterized protein n=1 Tax=Protopolystoma xenopodis TaxID=117903 RepID=A0A3S5BX65_9PLAT|nr:unnamed protein product [Protopolystoma xenopodis]